MGCPVSRYYFRFEKIGRRIVLQLFTARSEDAPACVLWERIRAKDRAKYEREFARRGYLPFSQAM